ncbi:hypothetical protein AB1Y20_011911 [Prymnesium parvum]|uniref:Copper transporter n=1 Tax=Prymnesium parvum TaxID=97485 RepID=A0AB34IN02_PRYPA
MSDEITNHHKRRDSPEEDDLFSTESPAMLLLSVSWLMLAAAHWLTDDQSSATGAEGEPILPSGHPRVPSSAPPCERALQVAASQTLRSVTFWGITAVLTLLATIRRVLLMWRSSRTFERSAGPVPSESASLPAFLKPGARVRVGGVDLTVPGPPPGPPPT